MNLYAERADLPTVCLSVCLSNYRSFGHYLSTLFSYITLVLKDMTVLYQIV